MKVFEALSFAKSQLKEAGIDSFSLDAIILLRHLTNFSKEQIIFDEKLDISDEIFAEFDALIKRRCQKEPISHLINHREFFGLDFFVNQNSLDPRPDSEILVELAIEKTKNFTKKIKTLEIGVGSGCLTISILKNAKNIEAFGVDLCEKALEVCRKNIVNHKLENEFEVCQSDLFQKVDKSRKFDIIISNPPYIKRQDIENLQDEVKKFEPKKALDGGEDGLDFYRAIAVESGEFLNENGLIILEIGFDQKEDVVAIFEERGFVLDEARRDLGGRDRVLCFKI